MVTIIPFPVERCRNVVESSSALVQIDESIQRLRAESSAPSEASARLHWQIDALQHGLKLLGANRQKQFPLLSAALANIAITAEAGLASGTASRNTRSPSNSPCA